MVASDERYEMVAGEMADVMNTVLDHAQASMKDNKIAFRQAAVAGSYGYIQQYPALLQLARDAPNTENGFMMLGLATYGWMPTIWKSKKDFDPESTTDRVSFTAMDEVRKIGTASEAWDFLTSCGPHPIINNSWVGTSKVLHFLSPEIFPIWDSRIASLFRIGKPSRPKERYLAYVMAAGRVVEDRKASIAYIKNIFDCEQIKIWSDMRMLEFLLFSQAKKI